MSLKHTQSKQQQGRVDPFPKLKQDNKMETINWTKTYKSQSVYQYEDSDFFIQVSKMTDPDLDGNTWNAFISDSVEGESIYNFNFQRKKDAVKALVVFIKRHLASYQR